MSKLLLILSLFFGLNVMAAEQTSNIYAGEKNISMMDEQPPVPSPNPPPQYYTFFDWARGQNGWGYCYEFDNYGVLHNGRPMPNRYCEMVNPSYFAWGRGFDGYIYCYQWTPYQVIMNDGYAVHPSYCRYK